MTWLETVRFFPPAISNAKYGTKNGTPGPAYRAVGIWECAQMWTDIGNGSNENNLKEIQIDFESIQPYYKINGYFSL